jgi:cell shape-determining protein MreC
MPPSLWQRGLISVIITLTVAIGLLASPAERTEPLRKQLRDAVAPGAGVAARLQAWLGVTNTAVRRSLDEIHLRPASNDNADQLAAVTAERDLAWAEQRQLAARLAALRAELDAARAGALHLLSCELGTPLVQTAAVTARVLGNGAANLPSQEQRLLDAGTAHGLADGDLILQSPIETSDGVPADLLIDQGADQHLQPDWLVTSRGALLGRVRECGQWTSSVQRITDPQFRVAARLVRHSPEGPVFGAAGVFAGAGTTGGELMLVPTTEPVAVGDRVYTQERIAGQSLMLLIGTVAAAELPDGEPHWNIAITPTASEPGLTVEVLKLELNPRRLAANPGADDAQSTGGVQ